MVSHLPPDPHPPLRPYPPSAPPAASAKRASSVTSGRSHTTRHRHARTHHGGSTTRLAQNEFPVFAYTGDVEIVVSTADGRKENRYVLHRLILSQCSGFFEAGTRAEWSGARAGGGRGLPPGLGRIDESVGGSSRASSQERRSSSDTAGLGNDRRWRYVLDWRGASDGEPPMLVQQDHGPASIFGGGGGGDDPTDRPPPPARGKPPPSNEGFFRSMTNFSALNLNERSHTRDAGSPGDEILKDYDNLFRTMYQYSPILDGINIATAYTECKALLHLADMYDALDIVGSRVDHHLLRFGSRLFKQIAKYPPSYLKLGYLARSRTIFTESLIHVVGQWPLGSPQLKHQVDADVIELIEDKVDEMREREEKVEFKLWRLTLTTSRGERVSPANDYLSWLAISLFRQWLAENTTPTPIGILKDSTRAASTNNTAQTQPRSRANSRGGSANVNNHLASQRVSQQPPPQSSQPTVPNTGRVYLLLGSPPSAYLSHEELKRFLKLQPDLYHRENLKRFERRIDEIKNLARDAVAPLMRNFLELDLTSFGPAGLGYLSCTRLEARDLPWEDA